MTQTIKKSYGTQFKCFSTNQKLNGTRLTLSQYVFEQLEICFKSRILVGILINNSYRYDKFYYFFLRKLILGLGTCFSNDHELFGPEDKF